MHSVTINGRLLAIPTILLLLLVCAVPDRAIAHEPEAEEKPAPANTADADAAPADDEPAVAPVPASEVAAQSEELLSQLRKIQEGLKAQDDITKIEESLPEESAALSKHEAKSKRTQEQSHSLPVIEDTQREWERFRTDLGRWADKAHSRSSELAEQGKSLTDAQKLWEATRTASSSGEKYPQAVVERIDDVLAVIAETQKQHEARRTSVLELQDDLSDLRVRIDEATAGLDDASEKLRGRRLSLHRPPIWQAGQEKPGLIEQLRISLERVKSDTVTFWDDHASRVPTHFGVFVVLLVGILLLRYYESHQHTDDSTVQIARRMLQRPVAVAILLALLFSRSFYPDAPEFLLRALRLLTMLVALLLIPSELRVRHGAALLAFVIAFALSQFRSLAIDGSILRRVILAAAAILAGCSIVSVLRTRDRPRAFGQHVRAVVALCQIALFLLGASLVANLIGAVALADLLTNGVTNSVAAIIVVWLAAIAIVGVIWLTTTTGIAQTLHAVADHGDLIRQRAKTLITILAVCLWARFTLEQFDVLDPLYEWVSKGLNHNLGGGDMAVTAAGILRFFIAISVGVIAARLIRFFLDADVLSRTPLPRGVPGAISSMVYYTIICLGIVAAFSAAGLKLSELQFLMGAVGVGIGFGLRNVINNFVCGVIVIFERPINVGDEIEVGPQVGRVKAIGIRATNITTPNGADVLIPNSKFISTDVINWTLSDNKRRIELALTLPYFEDTDKLTEVLVATVSGHEDVFDTPAPVANVTDVKEAETSVIVRCWVDISEKVEPLRGELFVAIDKALRELGVYKPEEPEEEETEGEDGENQEKQDGADA